MNDKPHSLWLPSWYPSEVHPFQGNFTQRWTIADSKYRRVTVLALVEGNQGWKLSNTEVNLQLTEIRVYFPESKYKAIRFIRYLKAGMKGVRYVQSKIGKPDVLHLCVVYPAGALTLLFSLLYRIPLVVSEHWTGYKKADGNYRGLPMKILSKLVFWRAAAIIALNPAMVKALRQHGLDGEFHLVPNVVSTENLPSIEHAVPKNPFKFIHVSGLDDRQKNISGILQAVKVLAAKRQDFKLVLVGGGEQVAHFQATADSLGIAPFADFLGAKPHDEVLQDMAASDAFVLFSNFENLPCVILEAMGIGLPVIATETGSMHEWIDESTGILLEIRDIDGLVKAMDFMIDHSHEFDAEKSKRLIKERCSPEVIGQAFSDVYVSVISAKKSE